MESHYSLQAKHILKSQFLPLDFRMGQMSEQMLPDSQKTTCRGKATVSLTPSKGLEKGRAQECWLGDRLNHKLIQRPVCHNKYSGSWVTEPEPGRSLVVSASRRSLESLCGDRTNAELPEFQRELSTCSTRSRRQPTLPERGAQQPHDHPRIPGLWFQPRSVL